MNPVVRKYRRFKSVYAQQGARAAARQTAHSLRNSVVYRWQLVSRHLGALTRGAPRPPQVLPDNDRYAADAFLPAASEVPPGSVAVVIPAYRGLEVTRDCIESVLAAPSPAVGDVLIVDDASPEPSLSTYLDDLARRGRVRLLRNPENVGFVASANRGMEACAPSDVILLNSDTIVAGDWADRIAAHALRFKIGTVTPFSNNATICSYPRSPGANRLPPEETVATVDEAFATANRGRSCQLPTGVGFCMYISRACLDDVGAFDEQTFGRGYGEENDFCLRAAAKGWRHLLAADTYVWHRGEVSFGNGAASLQKAALECLNERYPSYLASVARHVEEDPGRPWRVAATAARYRAGRKPVVLVILHAHGTGTEKHALDLCRRFGDQVRFLILRVTFEGPVRLSSPDPDEALDVHWRMSGDISSLVGLVKSFGVGRVHIHHTLGLPFDVHAFVRALGVSFDFTVHDYFAICPRIRLVTPQGRHCGGPDDEECAACLALRPAAPERRIDRWHAKNSWLLSEAERVICPSRDAAGHVARFNGGGDLRVALHDTLDGATFPAASPPRLREGERLRVALLGVLSDDKGARIVGRFLQAHQNAPECPEIHLIGYVPDEYVRFIQGTPLRATGPYTPDELQERLARARPHVVWFPAEWPETYSYTLSEAMTARLPVLAPDVGAFSERLASRGWSWVVPLGLGPDEYALAFSSIAGQLRSGAWSGPRLPGMPERETARERYPVEASQSFYENDYLRPLTSGLAGHAVDG